MVVKYRSTNAYGTVYVCVSVVQYLGSPSSEVRAPCVMAVALVAVGSQPSKVTQIEWEICENFGPAAREKSRASFPHWQSIFTVFSLSVAIELRYVPFSMGF